MIDAKFEGLVPANSFGVEYLTYVLWAITPEGRPVNLGEVLPDGSKNEITVTTDLQSYGLIVTAEPYFAVTMPSDVVVYQNYALPDKTQGIIETVNAHFSLLPRGAYSQTAGQHTVLNPITRNDKSPLELYEAINAVQIARSCRCQEVRRRHVLHCQPGPAERRRAWTSHKSERKQEITYAREAVQAAEDARIMTIRKMKAEDEERQREASAQAVQQSNDAAQQAALQAQQAATSERRRRRVRLQAEAAAEKARADQAAAQQQARQATIRRSRCVSA